MKITDHIYDTPSFSEHRGENSFPPNLDLDDWWEGEYYHPLTDEILFLSRLFVNEYRVPLSPDHK